MVERVVFVKLKDSSDRERVAAAAREALPRIPVVTHAHVGLPADDGAEVWDLMLVIRFARYEDVPVYIDDPVHVAFVQQHLAPYAEVKKAWNFSVSRAGG